jgi:parallel beta-helix repeat protein
MRVGRRRKGFDLDGGADWLVVEGLTFRNYNDNAIHSIGSTDCQFRGLTLHTNFITGIYLTGSSYRSLIEKCSFWDNGHGGIELASTRHTTIRKNRFVKRDLGDGCGGNGAHLWLGPVGELADSNLIENNIAFATGRQGLRGPFIAVAGSYNIIRHNSIITSGMGGIVLLDGGNNAIINNALDMSDAMHGIGVFPDAVSDGGHVITGNCFYAQDPTAKFWWDNVKYNSVAEWESAGAQTGNIDSMPGFFMPDREDLHLAPGSACIDHGTQDSAATDDFDGKLRPQGAGFDIGAFEYVGVGVAEGHKPQASSHKLEPTIVHAVLFVAGANDEGQGTRDELLDISGRCVMPLRRGPNDVSRLSPGVYFVREAPSARRVVVLRSAGD